MYYTRAVLLFYIITLLINTGSTNHSSENPRTTAQCRKDMFRTRQWNLLTANFEAIEFTHSHISYPSLEKVRKIILNQQKIKDLELIASGYFNESPQFNSHFNSLIVIEVALIDHFIKFPNHKVLFNSANQLWKEQCFVIPSNQENIIPGKIRNNLENQRTNTRLTAIDEFIKEAININNISADNFSNYDLLSSAILGRITIYLTILSLPYDERDLLRKFLKYFESGEFDSVSETLDPGTKKELRFFLELI